MVEGKIESGCLRSAIHIQLEHGTRRAERLTGRPPSIDGYDG